MLHGFTVSEYGNFHPYLRISTLQIGNWRP